MRRRGKYGSIYYMDNRCPISIIVRTKNESRHLGEVFESLHMQTFQDFEIIIIDSGSTDKTLDIVEEYDAAGLFTRKIILIKIAPEEFNYPFASNLGAETAQGKYLVYLSGHSVPVFSTWLEDGLKVFNPDPKENSGLARYKKKIMGVYCQTVYPLNDASRFERLLCFWGRIIYRGRKVVSKPLMGCMGATNCMLRRDLWEKHHFNLAFANGGEDGAWAYYWLKHGYVAIRDFRFTVKHTHGLGPWGYFKQYLHWLSCFKPREFEYRKHKFN